MDPVRSNTTRCSGCNYYVCTCTGYTARYEPAGLVGKRQWVGPLTELKKERERRRTSVLPTRTGINREGDEGKATRTHLSESIFHQGPGLVKEMLAPEKEKKAIHYHIGGNAACKRGFSVNAVERLHERKKPLRISEFIQGRTLRCGPWYEEREARLRGGDTVFSLKQLKRSVPHSSGRIEQERAALARLSGQRDAWLITRMFRYFEHDESVQCGDSYTEETCRPANTQTLYLVQEFPAGGPLTELLTKNGVLPSEATKYYCAQAFSAIMFLHENGITHRDIQPANMLLDAKGRLKLGGFTFATQMGRGDRTLTLVGTAPYAAPEVFLLQGYGNAVDWFGLGASLYEMIQGIPPFGTTELSELIHFYQDVSRMQSQVMSGDVDLQSKTLLPITRARGNVDLRAWDIVKQLLHSDPRRRTIFAEKHFRQHVYFKFYNREKLDWSKLAYYEPPLQPPGKYPLVVSSTSQSVITNLARAAQAIPIKPGYFL